MTNGRFIKRVLPVLLIAVSLTTVFTASARTPPAREWCGVIERIDLQARTLAVRSDKESKTFELMWRDRTQFVHNSKFDSPAALKNGAKVCVFYRAPIFGKPFATRVVWSE